MLFHVTVVHAADECPGRNLADPPALIAPSDSREALGRELGVRVHFVLWGASCMLWAQPEHLAFAVLEAEDVEAVLRFVGSLIPSDWTYSAVPVWNLPAQLRLVRQVRQATPIHFPATLETEGTAESSSATGHEDLSRDGSTEPAAPERASAPQDVVPADAAPVVASRAGEDDVGSADSAPVASRALEDAAGPGTITRLLDGLGGSTSQSGDWLGAMTLAQRWADQPASPRSSDIGDASTRDATSSARYWLVAMTGPSAGTRFRVSDQTATVGRTPDCQVYIPDGQLSREHARMQFRDGAYWLTDTGSTNGTTLNGRAVEAEQRLQDGDTIALGTSTLVLRIEPDSAPGTQPQAE